MFFRKNNVVLLFGTFFVLLLLSSCTAKLNKNTHDLASRSGIVRLSSLSFLLPSGWKVVEDVKSYDISQKEQNGHWDSSVVVARGDGSVKAIISTKKMVDPPAGTSKRELINAYGRISIKPFLEEGLKKSGTDTKLFVGGEPAVQYNFVQGDVGKSITFVRYADHLFVVQVAAPKSGLSRWSKLVYDAISFGQSPVSAVSEKTKISSYKISPHIPGLHINDLIEFRREFKVGNNPVADVGAEVSDLEKFLFVTAFLKVEEADKAKDYALLPLVIQRSKEMFRKNKEVTPVRRCYGLALYLENKFEESFELLKSTASRQQGDTYAKLYLALIRPYRVNEAKVEVEYVLKKDPDNLLAKYLKSKILFAQGKKNVAISLLKKELKEHPANLWLNYAYAKKAETDKQRRDAKKRYIKVLKDNSYFVGARFNLALLYYRDKRNKDALEQLDMILSAYPDDVPSYLLKGLLYRRNGQDLLARKQFESALNVEPDNYKALYNLGALCAAKLGDKSCARLAFSRYLQVSPRNDRSASVANWLSKNK